MSLPFSPWTLLAQINQWEAGLGGLPRSFTQNNIRNGLVVVFGIAGGIALIIMAFGALKFVLSQGNPQEVTKAKNTIIDGLIGLVIIVASGGIVGFVVAILAP